MTDECHSIEWQPVVLHLGYIEIFRNFINHTLTSMANQIKAIKSTLQITDNFSIT
jgi:hypothetical protein